MAWALGRANGVVEQAGEAVVEVFEEHAGERLLQNRGGVTLVEHVAVCGRSEERDTEVIEVTEVAVDGRPTQPKRFAEAVNSFPSGQNFDEFEENFESSVVLAGEV